MPEILEPHGEEKEKLSNGQWLWKTLKPAGCIFVLLLAVVALVLCFTAGSDPIKGYAPPESGEYYAAHLDELKTELEENVFPNLEGVTGCEVSGSKVAVSIEYDSFSVTRSALLHYFDSELLELIQLEKQS